MKIDSQASADLRKLGDLLDGIEVVMLTTRAAERSSRFPPARSVALLIRRYDRARSAH